MDHHVGADPNLAHFSLLQEQDSWGGYEVRGAELGRPLHCASWGWRGIGGQMHCTCCLVCGYSSWSLDAVIQGDARRFSRNIIVKPEFSTLRYV